MHVSSDPFVSLRREKFSSSVALTPASPSPKNAGFQFPAKHIRRWETFSAWYYPPPIGGPAFPTPQRQALLGGEVSAAAADETIRIGMREEDILTDGGNFNVHEFVVRYCSTNGCAIDLRMTELLICSGL